MYNIQAYIYIRAIDRSYTGDTENRFSLGLFMFVSEYDEYHKC